MSMTDDSACLDAETLAAWADEALDAGERSRVEAHAADCARCQAMLAAMVRTMAEPAAAKAPWRMPGLAWLVPLTAAAAVAIWIAVPNPSPRQVSDGGVEAVEPAAPARAAAPAPANGPAAAPAPESFEASADARERRQTAALDKKEAAPAESNALTDNANKARAASPLTAPASAADAGATAQLAAPSPSAPAARMAFSTRLDVVVVSSNPSTRFRLLPGGGVQRSADGGATWRNEIVPVTEPLTAGSSPSPSVCWLVGPSGTVLLTTDGRSWRRLAFPEAVELRAVVATDHESATVTTADGRSFVTTDAGQTWSRAPDL